MQSHGTHPIVACDPLYRLHMSLWAQSVRYLPHWGFRKIKYPLEAAVLRTNGLEH